MMRAVTYTYTASADNDAHARAAGKHAVPLPVRQR